MKKIRKNTFETNSSSCHSISLAGDDKQFVFDTMLPDQFGVVTINGGEFGWEWIKFNDVETKASYAATDFQNSEANLEMLREVIQEQTGCETVEFAFGEYSYIDHESVGHVPRNKVDLRNFLFNKIKMSFHPSCSLSKHK